MTDQDHIDCAKMHAECRRADIIRAFAAIQQLRLEDYHFIVKCKRKGFMDNDALDSIMREYVQALINVHGINNHT